jgi:hypothetical protein
MVDGSEISDKPPIVGEQKKVCGTTFKQYILRIKKDQACLLDGSR